MPLSVRRNLDELSNILGTSVVPNKDYSKFGATIEELTTSAIERRTVSMHYDSLSSVRNEQRLFDPYNIYLDPDGATLKTIGYDHRNARLSPFSLDRIKKHQDNQRKLCTTGGFRFAEIFNGELF